MKKTSLILIILFFAWTVFAADKNLLDIQGIPPSNIEDTQTSIGEYNGKGTIDKIYPDRIVINDSIFYLDAGVKMVNTSGRKYSGKLKENNFVYYFLNKDKKISKIVLETQ